MRILFSGEGPQDQGRLDAQGRYVPGPATVYLRRLLESRGVAADQIEFALFDRKKEKALRGKNRHLGARVMRAKGHGTMAALLLQRAAEDGYDLAVFYVDADKPEKPHDEPSCKKRWQELVEEIDTGLAASPSSVPLLPCVPVKMIECWLLADEEAIRRVAGTRRSVRCGGESVPAKPELIWGDSRNPGSDFPKCKIQRVLASMHVKANAATYLEIAEESELGVVVKRCPISFATFSREIANLVSNHKW